MKSKKLKNRIFTCLFLIICLLPLLGMLVFGPSKAAANEILASKPRIIDRQGAFNPDFLTDVGDYVADRFWLRQSCVTGWSLLNSALFHTSVDKSVILGSNGTLYYADDLADYMGVHLPEEQLRSAARNLYLMQEYVESRGADFVFTVAPNKSSLYKDNMPSWIPENHDAAGIGFLTDCMAEQGVRYADLFAALSREETLYYDTDSHWNSKGAALGADVILAAAGISSDFFGGAFTDGEQHTGDLYEMLYPAGRLTETDFRPETPFTFTTEANANGGNATTINSSCASGSGRLLCWRDSFGAALYPYLAELFEQACFSRANSYDFTMLDGSQTLVIIELVERNISWLFSRLPVLPSPERSVVVEAESSGGTFSTKSVSAAGGEFTQLSITLPGELYDCGEPAFIRCDGTVYEALVSYSTDGEPTLTVLTDNEPSSTPAAVCPCNGVMTEYAVTE